MCCLFIGGMQNQYLLVFVFVWTNSATIALVLLCAIVGACCLFSVRNLDAIATQLAVSCPQRQQCKLPRRKHISVPAISTLHGTQSCASLQSQERANAYANSCSDSRLENSPTCCRLNEACYAISCTACAAQRNRNAGRLISVSLAWSGNNTQRVSASLIEFGVCDVCWSPYSGDFASCVCVFLDRCERERLVGGFQLQSCQSHRSC